MFTRLRAFITRATGWALPHGHDTEEGACPVCGRAPGPDPDQVILLSHELSNLFSIIAGCASAMNRRADRRLPIEPEFRRLTLALNRAERVIGRLQTVDAPTPVQRAPIEMSRAITECAEMLERVLGERIRLKLDLAMSRDLVLAAPSEIDRIVLNLAISARDAMPDGGTLTIRTAPVWQATQSYIRLTVTDTGAGMPSDVKLRILNRLPPRLQRGAELGLTAVAHTVNALGGTLQIEGDQGLGTQIDVDLPCVDVEAAC